MLHFVQLRATDAWIPAFAGMTGEQILVLLISAITMFVCWVTGAIVKNRGEAFLLPLLDQCPINERLC